MDKILRLVIIGFITFIGISFLIGIISIGLSIMVPVLFFGLILYGLYYIYQRVPFLQKMVRKYAKKEDPDSFVTTYYETDEYGNRRTVRTTAYIIDKDNKKN